MAFLGLNKLSVIERCPYYRGVRKERLDCTNYFFFSQDFLGKSDPYLELARSKEDGTFVVVHRTEVCLKYYVMKSYNKKKCTFLCTNFSLVNFYLILYPLWFSENGGQKRWLPTCRVQLHIIKAFGPFH